jgi:small-conductance mechanosensitive channel
VQALIPIDWQQLLDQGLDWLHRYVLLPALLAQLICVLLLLGAARWASPALQRMCLDLAGRVSAGPLRAIAIAFARVADWVAVLLALWFARLAFNAAGDRADLLRLAESLVLVWVLIRFSSQLVRDERLARAIAVLAWIIAALNIAGLITPAVGLLDAMSVPVGNFRVSLLLVLKGAITLAIFVWIANVASRLIDQRLRVFGPLTPAVQVLAAKLVRMTLLTLAVVLALGSIGIDLTAFAVFSGAVGVGVGFGLQKVVSNLISGVILLMDRSIKPGDVIEIDSTLGSVIALNARYASVQTRDGKEYLIPNEDLITLERPHSSARQGGDLVSLRPAQGDSAGTGGGARCAACAARTGTELRAGRVRRQHGRSRTPILDPRSGERHRQCAQRRDAEHVGSVPATRRRTAASAT